jgi:calcineurin-like phosphoesterase family protein
MRWFIGDTHFNHRNVITYDNRPFRDVQHMEEEIVGKWNATVRPDDIVYHLGDFAFGPTELQKELYDKLNGNKILIRGNHDGSQSRCEKLGWRFVCDGLLINLSGLVVFLIHDPVMAPEGVNLVHAHTHKPSNRSDRICVSCNVHNYLPISEKQVIKHLNRRGK